MESTDDGCFQCTIIVITAYVWKLRRLFLFIVKIVEIRQNHKNKG